MMIKINNRDEALFWFQENQGCHFWIRWMNENHPESHRDCSASIGYHGNDAEVLEGSCFNESHWNCCIPFSVCGCDDSVLEKWCREKIFFPLMVERIAPHPEDTK